MEYVNIVFDLDLKRGGRSQTNLDKIHALKKARADVKSDNNTKCED